MIQAEPAQRYLHQVKVAEEHFAHMLKIVKQQAYWVQVGSIQPDCAKCNDLYVLLEVDHATVTECGCDGARRFFGRRSPEEVPG